MSYPPDVQHPDRHALAPTEALKILAAGPDDRDRGRMLVACLGIVALVALVLAGLALTMRVDLNTTNAVVAKDKATVASKDAKVAKKSAGAVKGVAKRADKRSKSTLRYLQGKQGLPGVPGRGGKEGAPGPPGPGPSKAQMDAAVERYCAAVTCGSPPSVAQVLEALRACADSGGCRGPAGLKGDRGDDAPAVTDAQLDASTARYCAPRNACSGAMGPMGMPGPPGPAGADGSAGPAPLSVPATRPDGQGGVEACTATDPDGDLNYEC
jgi:hypothetical protein